MNELPVLRLTNAGAERFAEWLALGAPNSRPDEWLTDEELTCPLEATWTVDADLVFPDRAHLGAYLWDRMKGVWSTDWENDSGLWSWLCLVYFEQFRPSGGLSHRDNYIYDAHRHAYYRHCVAMPTKLARDYGDDARVFLSSDMTVMGEMLEQCMSRQYLMRSTTFRAAVRKLYFDETNGRLKPGAASKPLRKKLANGTWSKSGAGSVRRLALEVSRLDLTFNLEAMPPQEMITLLGGEYAKFQPSPS